MRKNTIIKLQPLGFPWVTQDPFLFCAFHQDAYPPSNGELGPNIDEAALEKRNLGQDFGPEQDWRMYHGQTIPGFPAHPHRGFETVTVVNKGIVDHSDSLGAAARYGQGDVQWLTAGEGIQHAELFPLLDEDNPNPLELFQIWLNLPSKSKMASPQFKIFWNQQVPVVELDEGRGRLRLVAGKHEETTGLKPPPDSWASQEHSDVAIWTIDLDRGARWTLPAARAGSNRTLYYFSGEGLKIEGDVVPVGHAIDLVAHRRVALESGQEDVRLLLLQGTPIGEPVAQRGPFVMNTTSELQQAFVDYRRTQFGGWPWESEAPHHGAKGRFAKYPDGRREEA